MLADLERIKAVLMTKREESDYPGKGSFDHSMEIINEWPSTRYQTMYGRVYECEWDLGKVFEELQQIRRTLQRDPEYAVADHSGAIRKIEEACKLLEMSYASLSDALTDLEKLERIAGGTSDQGKEVQRAS